MRVHVMVLLGSLLLSACGVEGDIEGEEVFEEPVDTTSQALGFSLDYLFIDSETWWRSGAQGLSGGSQVLTGQAIFYGREKTWVGRDFDFPAALAGWTCKTKVEVVLGHDEAYAKLRVKIRDAESESVMINHSYTLQADGPDLDRWVSTPKWKMPASGSVIVNLIADKTPSGLWNSFAIYQLVFSCSAP